MPVLLDPIQKTIGSGDPVVAVPGTGMSVPTSILTTSYDVNGLLINNRNDLEHYWVRKFDGLYDAEVRDNREVNPDRDGETYYGGLYAGKPLAIEGILRAQSLEKMLDMCNALTRAFDSLDGEYPIVARTDTFERDWLVYAVKTAQIGLVDEQTSMYFERVFQIPLRASKPRIYGYQLKNASVQLSVSDNLVLTNLGNKPAALRLMIYGRQDNISIVNNATQKTFVLNGSVPAADYYEIDFEEGTIYDSLGVNQFDQYEHTSDWDIDLAPEREQTITITSSNRDASAAVTAYWRDTYK